VHGFKNHKTAPAAVPVIKKRIVQIEKHGFYHKNIRSGPGTLLCA
jgi:hypothetical protein